MVIGSDPTIQPATILINIEASRAHFESLIANMSMMPPSGASGGDLGTMSGRGMVVDSNAGWDPSGRTLIWSSAWIAVTDLGRSVRWPQSRIGMAHSR